MLSFISRLLSNFFVFIRQIYLSHLLAHLCLVCDRTLFKVIKLSSFVYTSKFTYINADPADLRICLYKDLTPLFSGVKSPVGTLFLFYFL